MYCKNCGTEIREGAKFCASCGTAVEAEPKKEEFDFSKRYDNKPKGENVVKPVNEQKKEDNTESGSGNGVIMSAKHTSVLAYLTTLGFMIALIAGDREGAKFHLNQALLVHLFFVLAAVPFIGWAWGIFMLVCFIMGLSNAVNGIESPLPLIGKIKIFDK